LKGSKPSEPPGHRQPEGWEENRVRAARTGPCADRVRRHRMRGSASESAPADQADNRRDPGSLRDRLSRIGRTAGPMCRTAKRSHDGVASCLLPFAEALPPPRQERIVRNSPARSTTPPQVPDGRNAIQQSSPTLIGKRSPRPVPGEMAASNLQGRRCSGSRGAVSDYCSNHQCLTDSQRSLRRFRAEGSTRGEAPFHHLRRLAAPHDR